MMPNLKNLKISLFFNNYRGIKILNYLLKKKININHIFLAKKFLNSKIINHVKKTKIKFDLIENLENKKIYDLLKDGKNLSVICGFPYIFKKKLIKLTKLGILNCHAGKLPQYRGGSPLHWQMINNEKYIGLSVIKINEGIDAGNIVEEKKFKLLKNYYIQDVLRITNRSFPHLVFKSIKKIISNKKLKKQKLKNAKYYRQRKPKDSKINFKNIRATELDCFTRALNDPYPNAYFHFKNKIIKVKKIKYHNISLKPGEIKILNNNFYIGCKNSSVKLMDYKIVKIKKYD
tara:strand:+ start:1202 stop:2068 length:867 start_codon:yes stop_codon:yes gene_type:complete